MWIVTTRCGCTARSAMLPRGTCCWGARPRSMPNAIANWNRLAALAATPPATGCNLSRFADYNDFARGNRGRLCREATMLRDTLVGLIEPMLRGAGVHCSRAGLSPCCSRHRTIDPQCLENPRPAGAESTLTENARSPFHAEPRHLA